MIVCYHDGSAYLEQKIIAIKPFSPFFVCICEQNCRRSVGLVHPHRPFLNNYLRIKSLFFYLHDVMKTLGGVKIP